MNRSSRSKCILILGSGMHTHLVALFAAQASSDLCIITSDDSPQPFPQLFPQPFDDEKSRKDALVAALQEHFNPFREAQNLEHMLISFENTIKNTHESALDFASHRTYTPAPFKTLDAKSATLKHKSRRHNSDEKQQDNHMKVRPFI